MADHVEPGDGPDTANNLERDESAEPVSDGATIEPRRVVEAVLFATDAPVPPAKVAAILDVGDAGDVRGHIEALNEEYERAGMSFRIEEIAGGYQMLTLPEYNTWVTRLLRAKQETKLSQAAMETLAVVAYKQPVTRADIESIRGVAAGEMLQRLREMNLVKIVGRAEDLGRPLLYGTTKRFLEVFGLASLDDLPRVEALGGPSKQDQPGPRREEPETPDTVESVDTPTESSEDAPAADAAPPRLSVVRVDDMDDASAVSS